MPFDYKKEYKEFYMPKLQPSIVTVPRINYIAVRGQGDRIRRAGHTKRPSVFCMGSPSRSR